MAKITQAHIDALKRKVENYRQILEINNVLNSVLIRHDVGIDALLHYLMQSAVKLTASEGASVLLWDEEQNKLKFAATSTANRSSRNIIGQSVPLNSLAGTIFKERRLIEVDNITGDPRHYSQVDQNIQFETRSLLGVPLVSNNRAIGVLEVVNKHTLPWTEEDRVNLSVLASEAATAIEVAQLMQALQRANDELNELDKLKSDFIAIASHELRTPLGIILGYASFLQEDDDSAVSMQATKIMEGALQLRRIIESMINLRYIKQKSSELHLQPVALTNLLQDIKHDSLAIPGAASVEIQVAGETPAVDVLIDRSRIAMAFQSIISNAVTFSEEGGAITLSAHVEGGLGCVSVRDDGQGIEPAQLERIFEEFYQVEDHMIRHHGGLGIGLSITRAIVQAHNGKVWAKSDGIGHGATFTVALPLVK